MEAHPELRRARNRAARRLVRWTLFAVSLGVLVHVVLPAIPGISRSASALATLRPPLLILALLLEAGSNAALPQLYRRTISALGGHVSYREALRASMAMFTVGHIIPGGGAAAAVYGSRRFAAAGVAGATATTAVLLGGLIGMATLVAIVSVGSLGSLVRGSLSLVYAATIVILLGCVVAASLILRTAVRSRRWRDRLLSSGSRILDRAHLRVDLAPLRSALDHMTEQGVVPRLRPAIAWSAANWLLDAAALWVLFLGFGYRMHPGQLLVGYGVANIITILPVTPGGLGFVEAGLAGTYRAFGVPGPLAVVAVLTYRLISYWLPVLAGVPPYLLGARVPRALGDDSKRRRKEKVDRI
jgi:uncharacterized protein (TIRG00374 family)